MQCAVGIFDNNGNFIKAMDFHSTAPFTPLLSSVKPENSQSILIGGAYSNEYHASDTTLFAGDYGALFIGKFNETGKHKWIKSINGPFQDMLVNYLPAEDGSSIVVGCHVASRDPVWVNFFGIDSVRHTQTLTYVMKIDSLGNILWRTDCISLGSGVTVRNAVLGADGNIYIQGETRTSLVLGSDTLWNPGFKFFNFIYVCDGEGNLIYKQLRNWPLNMGNMIVDAGGNIIFSGLIHNTSYFANDTILIL
jgi:hypothetical protein